MFDSYAHLRRTYRLPVLPLALFLRVGRDGIGVDVYEERFWEFELLRFRYLYVGLPALDALEYVEGTTGSAWPSQRSCGSRRSVSPGSAQRRYVVCKVHH